MDANRHLRRKFRLKRAQSLPFTGWLNSNREHIAEIFCELGYKIGAEVGVRVGDYSEVLLRKNPGLKLFCIDSWSEFSRNSQHRQEKRFGYAQARLASYDVQFIRKTSMDALADIADGFLDFVYIDALHDFDNVMRDLIEWSKKVKSGGIVSGHDYINLNDFGVIPAVEAYTRAHYITQWYMTKDYGVSPSYLWVRP